MSASSALRRTLLTTSSRLLKTSNTAPLTIRRRIALPTTSVPNTTRRPTSRHFSASSAKMGHGVHNLKNKAEFDDARGKKGELMVLDCFATWCGPCKVIAPKVSEFANTYGDVTFYKLDVDEVPDVAQELAITAMPTFVLLKDGEVTETVVGANPAALEAAIKKHK